MIGIGRERAILQVQYENEDKVNVCRGKDGFHLSWHFCCSPCLMGFVERRGVEGIGI